MIANGTLSGGMLPKMTSAFELAQNDVKADHIIDGRIPKMGVSRMFCYWKFLPMKGLAA
jgi:hypothetical protein